MSLVKLNASAQMLPSDQARATIVVFGGLRAQGGYSIPAFEFVQTLQQMNYNVLFIKDETRRWYNFGLEGLSESMDGTSEAIERLLAEHFGKTLPLVMLGNSMGGYAAIYFGEKLKAHFVLALVPQTVISVEARDRLGDIRWRPELSQFKPRQADLRYALRGAARKIQVVVGEDCALDIVQAGNIGGARGVHIEIVKGAAHDVTRVWKAQGALSERIADYIDGAISA